MNPALYTVWSRGQLLGETTLDFVRIIPLHRMGWLCPTEAGTKLLARATEGSPAIFALGELLRDMKEGERPQLSRKQLEATPEFADLLAADSHRGGLEMELRGPDGSVIPTEWVDVRDTEDLIALSRQNERDGDIELTEAQSAEIDPAVEHDVAILEEWFAERDRERGWSPDDDDDFDENVVPDPNRRYQIQVLLLDDSAVP